MTLTSRFTPTCVGNTILAVGVTGTVNRFTPTCVGNTQSGLFVSRGNFGSPPRVWGILHMEDHILCPHTVHPHVCGEYVSVGQSWRPVSHGSPPRVWGIRVGGAVVAAGVAWFTPTCVGNTNSLSKAAS